MFSIRIAVFGFICPSLLVVVVLLNLVEVVRLGLTNTRRKMFIVWIKIIEKFVKKWSKWV